MKVNCTNDTKFSGRRSYIDRRVFDDPNFSGIERRMIKNRRGVACRRENKRFQIKDFTFVKLWSGPNEDIGQLLDLSKRGLSFRYFVTGKNPSNFSELGIFSSGCDLAIDGIPFSIISDTELNESSFGPIIFRRSGVLFGPLTDYQISKLNYFLKNFTLRHA
jgi:hypothetical protein